MNDTISLVEMSKILHKPPNRILTIIRLFKIPVIGKGMERTINKSDLKALDDFFYEGPTFRAPHTPPKKAKENKTWFRFV